MKDIVLDIVKESIQVKRAFFEANLEQIEKAVKLLVDCLASGNKILLFGNGGSAADAQHLAAEFVNRFMVDRPPLAAIALTTDTSIVTSVGNDFHFDDIFLKQVQALGRRGDTAIGISTSGNSPNVVKAVKAAAEMGLNTIALTGGSGELSACSDLDFCVASATTARIQETHIVLGHVLCDLVDRSLFPDRFRAETLPPPS